MKLRNKIQILLLLLIFSGCHEKKEFNTNINEIGDFKPSSVIHNLLVQNPGLFVPFSSELKKLGLSEEITSYLIKSAKYFYSFNKLDSSLLYSQLAITAANLSDDSISLVQSLNILGNNKKFRYHFFDAENHFEKAARISYNIEYPYGIHISNANLGRLFQMKGDYRKALDYYEKSLEISVKDIDSLTIAWTRYEVAKLFYSGLEAYEKSKSEAQSVKKIFTQYRLTNGTILSNRLLGKIALSQDSIELALDYFTRSLELCRDTLSISNCTSDIGTVLFKKSTSEKDLRSALNYLLVSSQMKSKLIQNYGIAPLELAAVYNTIGSIYLKLNIRDSSIHYLLESVKIAKAQNLKAELKDAFQSLSDYYASSGNYKNAYYTYLQYTELLKYLNEIKISVAEDYFNKEKNRQLIAREIEVNKRQRFLIAGLSLFTLFLLFIIFLVYRNYRYKRLTNIKLARQKRQIEIEKSKSEELLLNILPEKVAIDLKEKGKHEPAVFENVTVLLTDFVSFTKKAQEISPRDLMKELNEMYSAFDSIIKKNHCERIKTIGDAYLAVCGLPEPNPNHLFNIILSAKEMISYLNGKNVASGIQWQMRIGIHTGEVIGAVVGTTKYHYDIFGDTVNMVARLEALSEPMKINVSQEVYSVLKNKYKFESRQPMEAKGKGTIQCYFLDAESIQIPMKTNSTVF